MAFSSGTFSLYTPGNPVVTGTTIASTWANNTLQDIASGLSTCVLKDGSQTITGNIPFSAFKITGLGAATARTDAASLATIQDGTGVYVSTVGGSANAITLTPSPAITAYSAGQAFVFAAGATNSGATTVAVSGLTAKSIFAGNSALVGGELHASIPVKVVYDGTQFQLLGPIAKQPTRTVLTSGTGATYTTPTGATRINVRLVGGGAGGGAQNTNPGTAGNNTTFGTLTGSGGSAGIQAAAGSSPGGAASGGDINIAGSAGIPGQVSVSTAILVGGMGGDSIFGGAGAAGGVNANGGAAATNSGSGGGGAGGAAGTATGGGGGAGGYVEKLFTAPATTYTYTVGASVAGGAAGAQAGGTGAAGIIIVDEFYN